MILRIYRVYKVGKTIYRKMLKPFYDELRKDAYATEDKKRTKKRIRKTNKEHADNKKPNRSHQRKSDT